MLHEAAGPGPATAAHHDARDGAATGYHRLCQLATVLVGDSDQGCATVERALRTHPAPARVALLTDDLHRALALVVEQARTIDRPLTLGTVGALAAGRHIRASRPPTARDVRWALLTLPFDDRLAVVSAAASRDMPAHHDAPDGERESAALEVVAQHLALAPSADVRTLVRGAISEVVVPEGGYRSALVARRTRLTPASRRSAVRNGAALVVILSLVWLVRRHPADHSTLPRGPVPTIQGFPRTSAPLPAGRSATTAGPRDSAGVRPAPPGSMGAPGGTAGAPPTSASAVRPLGTPLNPATTRDAPPPATAPATTAGVTSTDGPAATAGPAPPGPGTAPVPTTVVPATTAPSPTPTIPSPPTATPSTVAPTTTAAPPAAPTTTRAPTPTTVVASALRPLAVTLVSCTRSGSNVSFRVQGSTDPSTPTVELSTAWGTFATTAVSRLTGTTFSISSSVSNAADDPNAMVRSGPQSVGIVLC